MDCICLKRKHKKRREKKFRPISPHVSPVHSQPSTLGHVPEARLPKVNSTGLWYAAPSVYAAGPAPAYYYGRPYGKHPHHIQRASSETRLPQARPYAPYRPMFTSQNNVFMIPAATGQRIYHSQQLAPVYEMPPVPGMEIYDVYQFAGGNSRSKLLETKHSHNYHNSEFRLHNRLERSRSDAQERPSRRHEGRRTSSKDRAPVPEGPKRQSSSKERQHFANSQRSSRSGESHTNKGFAPDHGSSLERVPETKQQQQHQLHGVTKVNGDISVSNTAIHISPQTTSTTMPNGTAGVVSASVPSNSTGNISSATDSMKLLAKNKTDDQKTIVQPGLVSVMVGKEGDSGNEINYQRYVYHGDIYAVPNKASTKIISGNLNDEGNPILSRMKEMVIEKSRTSAPNSPRSDSNDPYAIIGSSSSIHSSDPIVYEEIKTTKVTRTEVETTTTAEDALAGLDLPDPADLAKLKDEPKREVSESKHATPAPVTVTTHEQETGEATTTSPVGLRTHTELSPRGSVDGEVSQEDLSNAAKRITESAFTFLDKYLSDDEGTDTHVESPPLSPTGLRAQTVGD